MFRNLVLCLAILSGCATGGGAVQPATPDVAQEVVQRVLQMDCGELSTTERTLSLIEEGQVLARILLASGQLAGTGLTEGLLGQTEEARRQTGQLVDFMQLVRLCPR
ncbi:hypothetical protein [Pontivivens nitratireducens]|uniref:hypothetical protein n=1 Tax=Pontivivens nitratireducens TaxID=2758038 RepID=UPI00163B37FF|nr:hypothetical protein [Pontibrevibacter nitratireducens]